uniref:SUEL-type lectin domain-containing protein n=1 Tax=Macrostomum lignano TaxID=282301 RepID=A0A1I8FWB5_9PLAT
SNQQPTGQPDSPGLLGRPGHPELPPGALLKILGAEFGQSGDPSSLCNRFGGGGRRGATCDLPDAAQLIATRCGGRRSCRIVGPELPGARAACPGQLTQLTVRFTCLPAVHTVLLCSGSYRHLSCEETQSLTILHARLTNKYILGNLSCPDTVKVDSGYAVCPDRDMTNPFNSLCRRNHHSCSVKATFPPDRGCAHANLLLVYSCVPSSQQHDGALPDIEGTEADANLRAQRQQQQKQKLQQNRNKNRVVNDQDRPAADGDMAMKHEDGTVAKPKLTPGVTDNGQDGQVDLLLVSACGCLATILLIGLVAVLALSRRRHILQRQRPPAAGVTVANGDPARRSQLTPPTDAGANAYLLPRRLQQQ